MTIIKIICSYCKKNMGQKDGEGQTGISHGICDECLEKVREEIKALFGK